MRSSSVKTVFSFILSPVLCAALFALPTSAVVAADKVSTEEAAKIYRENCAVCHGDRGDGQTRARFGLNPPPRDFTSPTSAAQLNRERMIKSVAAGREGTAMVGWGDRLTPAEIEGLVDYIRNTFMVKVPTEEELAAINPRTERGRRIYEEHCRVCHGDRGNGATWTNSVLDPAPRNFTSPQSRRILTRKRMLASVKYGRKDTAMMSFQNRLSFEEIGEVVDYIRDTFMKGPVVSESGMGMPSQDAGGHGGGHAQAPSSIAGHGMAARQHSPGVAAVKVDMEAGFPGELKGNFERGRDFYMQNCSTCHGTRGDGLGPRAYFINPKPRNFLNPVSRETMNRPALFKAIVIGKVGTVMPAWGKVLSPQQVADVAEFVYQDFIHPEPDKIESVGEAESEGDKKKAR